MEAWFALSSGCARALCCTAGTEEHWEDAGDGPAVCSSLPWGFAVPGIPPEPGTAFSSKERAEASPSLRGTRASVPCASDGCLPHVRSAGFKTPVGKAAPKQPLACRWEAELGSVGSSTGVSWQ